MDTVEIVKKEYLPEQQKLIDIFDQHLKSVMPDFPVVFKMPRVKSERRFINRIPCKTIGGRGDEHIISMQVIDFIRLMVKSGIEVNVT